MALLFLSSFDRSEPWIEAFRGLKPDLDIRVWPEMGDPADIRYALVWSPPPGVLQSLPRLEVIFSLGAGVDGLLSDPSLPDLPLVRMVNPGLTEGMTEWVVLQVLYWHRNQHAYRNLQAEARWEPLAEKLARERKVGILGMGELGGAAARALAALGFDVTGWSRTPRTVPDIACRHGADGLAALLGETEILVCLLPLTPETRGILNDSTLAALPEGAVVINAARGGHVVEPDLLEALDSGHLRGASLDVFETEPLPPGHPFWTHPCVVVTPHVASITHARTAAAQIVDQIRQYEAGGTLQNLVDRRRGY